MLIPVFNLCVPCYYLQFTAMVL